MIKKILSVLLATALVTMLLPLSVSVSAVDSVGHVNGTELCNATINNSDYIVNTGVTHNWILPVVLICVALLIIILLFVTKKKKSDK